MKGALIFCLTAFCVCSATAGEADAVEQPLWVKKCRLSIDSCVGYMVDPFVSVSGVTDPFSADNSPTKNGHWIEVGGYTFIDESVWNKPPSGPVVVPLLVESFVTSGSYPARDGVAGYATFDSLAIAPRKAFRGVSGCWPIESFTLQDNASDEHLDLLVTIDGAVINHRSGEDMGQLYIYGHSLIHWRKSNVVRTDIDLAKERFFVISEARSITTFEAVTPYTYTENVKVRELDSKSCKEIASELPEFSSWDERSKSNIKYPPFPHELYRSGN